MHVCAFVASRVGSQIGACVHDGQRGSLTVSRERQGPAPARIEDSHRDL